MKTKPSATRNYSSPHDSRIDAVLRAYSQAVPAPGLESRVAGRIAANSRQSHQHQSTSRFLLLRRLSAAALAAAAAAAIVIGTVQHSRHIALQQIVVRRSRAGAVSAAAAERVPARSIPQVPSIDPKAPRTPPHGRANPSAATQ